MEVRAGEEDTTRLYEAATRGCTETLNALIHKDKLILNKVSLNSFAETPLHISSLLGHLDFTRAILTQTPKMTTKLDPLKRSPLHLASAEGHSEIIKALLSANNDACLIREEDGRIPLHLAATRGNVEAIQVLVRACPKSTSELLDGETVFHLCVKYNQLEALKLLVEMANDDELVSKGNQEGNTILHLAVMLKQLDTIRYLLSVPGVKAGVNFLNRMGFIAVDILDHSPRDFKRAEIRDVLIEAGGKRPTRRIECPPLVQSATSITSIKKPSELVKAWLNKCRNYMELGGDWIEDTHGALMTVATLIDAVTFQSALSPPGGVWQQDDTKSFGCSEKERCLAGTAILGYGYRKYYIFFVRFNNIAFVASLLVIFLIISGFPLRNKFCTWVLTGAMCTTLFFMALTYRVSLEMVTPDTILGQVNRTLLPYLFVWLGTLLMVSVIHMFRLFSWTSRKIKLRKQKLLQRHQQTSSTQQNPVGHV